MTVTGIDRLPRSTCNLFAIVKQILDTGVQLRSLAEPWADTGASTERLIIVVLSGLLGAECDLILAHRWHSPVYLAAILDAWSRKVIGYAISRSMDARIAVAALKAADQRP